MEDNQTSTGKSGSEIELSSISRFDGLIDIPITEKMIDSLIALFNYFDIYAPRIGLLYTIVSYLRFFQLIGGSFMAANLDSFAEGTLAQKVMSVLTVLFHIIPLEYRRGNEIIILSVVNGILLVMGIYMQYTAFSYKSTSKVPRVSLIILSVYLAIGPFLLVPISAQYTGQILSAYIQGTILLDIVGCIMVFFSFSIMWIYIWMIRNAYSVSLVWRPCSFPSIEGSPQTKLLITTGIMTLVSSLTTYFTAIPSAAMIVISIGFYCYSASTCFRCASYISKKHTVMVLGGSILGIVLCIANLVIIFLKKPWTEYFFAGFTGVGVICFVCTELFINARIRKELKLLDEIEDNQDISILKSKNYFKQILGTGFQYNHSFCTSLTIFKLACAEWKDALDVWALFAKFCAIYPENSQTLSLIRQSVASIRTKDKLQSIIIECTNYIIKTRETKFTPQLKNKISKLSKLFMKTKNRQRNIWDLVLQGNINDLSSVIKRTQDSVQECEIEMSHLLMQYPVNRFVAKQNLIFLNDVKGDIIQAKQYSEVLLKLQRGISVAEDNVHALGMEAWPNMPEVCSSHEITNVKTEDTINPEDSIIDDSLNIEALESISKQIDNHRIPAIRYMICSTMLAWFFLVVCPITAMLIGFEFFAANLSKPVVFMEGIAETRDIISILSGYVTSFFFYNLDDPRNPGHSIMEPLQLVEGFSLKYLGGSPKARDCLEYIARQVSTATEHMSKLRNFMPNNEDMKEVRSLLFANNIDFYLYIEKDNPHIMKSSIEQTSFMIANHVGKLLNYEVVDETVACGVDSLTARNNIDHAYSNIDESMHILLNFIKKNDQSYQFVFRILSFVLIAISVIVYPIIFFTQIRMLRKNRYEILQALTLLPKTVISAISASFAKLNKKDSTINTDNAAESDLSRQEESIIKLFNSISDGASKASIELSNFICFLLIMILTCTVYYLGINVFSTASETLMYNSHHINYVFGSNSYMFTVVGGLLKIALAKYDPKYADSIIDLEKDIDFVEYNLPILVQNFQEIRLGGPDPREVPFTRMEAEIARASNELVCPGVEKPPVTVMDSCHCFSAAQQFLIATSIVKKYVVNMKNAPVVYPDAAEMALQQLWQIGPVELYESFFAPASQLIVPIIIGNIKEEGDNLDVYAGVFISLTFVISLIIVFLVVNENAHLKFCLRLFLRCPPMSIMNNHRIMDLLSGNYNYTAEDTAERHASFSNEIVNKLNEVVIVTQEETSKIISVNNAFEEMFGLKQEEMKDKHIREFFTEQRFTSNEKLEKVFTNACSLIYTKENSDKIYLDFTTNCISGRRIYSGRDNTLNIMHEKMIADEKKKSDAMLASILPAMLVPRVQAGEKNISFAVQSATILFLDVVEFTPWCGSHDAQYVMRMLNIMFKEFDAITNSHKTMTKIKCIGDCYMAAGGIFDEINQPSIHAKEVVDSGCCFIKKLLEIDESEKENLRIRVGVNTGGPIVAGIIGTEKPTFEILGPAINIAHEMEHHGVPMKVHISRPVYELIYGQQFEIKERGEIDVKASKMFTYIVEP